MVTVPSAPFTTRTTVAFTLTLLSALGISQASRVIFPDVAVTWDCYIYHHFLRLVITSLSISVSRSPTGSWFCHSPLSLEVSPILTYGGSNRRDLNGTVKDKSKTDSKPIVQVTIKCGIHQEDALSPLQFCIGLNPLSHVIAKSAYGCWFQSGATMSHLLLHR